MNQPKPIQVRLPFSVPRPTKGQETQARICGICLEKDSRYVCPRCNVAYCSLDCFRSEKHNQCSEPFYKETVMQSISSDEKAGSEEKRRMMEMLQRFEDGEVGSGIPDASDDEEEDAETGMDEELAKRLEGVDLDNIDSNALLHLLPPEHRTRFLDALKNPESDETKYLLDLATTEPDEPEPPTELPWWEASDVPEDDDEGLRYAEMPHLTAEADLAGIAAPGGAGLKLVYNALAICVAYFHVLLSSRLPSLSTAQIASQQTQPDEVKTSISRLVPFVTDQRSTTRYESARQAYSAVWEAIGSSLESPPTQGSTTLLLRLLGYLPDLLHPPLDTASSPRIFHLLADLYRLYSAPKVGSASKKLGFYLVALRQLGRADWLRLEKEAEGEIRRLEGELGDGEEESAGSAPERANLLI